MLLDFLHSQLLCILSPCLQSKTIFFAFLSPTSGLHFSCKYPTPASDPAHPAFAIPSPEHLPRCSYPNITVYDCPCRYNTVFPDGHSATDRRARTDPASASDAPALHTQGHGNRPDTAAADAHRRGTDGIIFPEDAAFFFSSTAVCG